MTFVIHGRRTPCRKRLGPRKNSISPGRKPNTSPRRGKLREEWAAVAARHRVVDQCGALCPSVSGICAAGPDQQLLVFAVVHEVAVRASPSGAVISEKLFEEDPLHISRTMA